MFRWALAAKFHWTLPEIDSLPMADVLEYLRIEDGRAKAK